jgi:hypothetical protein
MIINSELRGFLFEGGVLVSGFWSSRPVNRYPWYFVFVGPSFVYFE